MKYFYNKIDKWVSFNSFLCHLYSWICFSNESKLWKN